MSDSGSETGEPSQSEMLLNKVQEGDKEGLKSILHSAGINSHFLLNTTHRQGGVEGNLIHFAIYFDQQHIVSYLFDELVRLNGSIATVAEICEPTFFALQLQKYSMVLLLLAKGCNPNQRRSKDGNTLLHCVCGRKAPPVNFIKQLFKLKLVDPNIQNDEGYTPLHLLAMKAQGVVSRDVAKLFKSRRAKLDMQTPDGKTAAMLTKNSYIREVLMLNVCGRRRDLPLLSFDDEDRINHMTLEDIHKNPIETPRELREERKKGRMWLEDELERKNKPKLSLEDQETVTNRLFKEAAVLKEQKLAALERKYIQPTERTVLTSEQIDISNRRLYEEPVERKEAKMEELMDKYVGDTQLESSVLTEELMNDSVLRLYNSSIEKHKETHQKLHEKYVTPSLEPRRKCKSDIEQGVQKLYYKALEQSKDRQSAVYNKYVPAAGLVKTRRLKKFEQKQMADRLSQATGK